MPDAKRNEIKNKVSAAKSRNQQRTEPTTSERAGERAIEVKDKFAAFAREHPIATVAGGLAVGVLVSSLFRGSPTRKAGRAIGKKTAGLAAIATELALAFAQQAYEAADEARRTGTDKLGELGGAVGDSARNLSEDAAEYAASAADAARKAGKSAFKSIRSRLN
jgi:ElaB/YqjD/DUF883 family membrane-anchored ribosome-binding protein